MRLTAFSSFYGICVLASSLVYGSCVAWAADNVTLGKGHYTTALRAGGEHEPPAPLANGNGKSPHPVRTNQWYSSLLFSTWGQPLYALPLSYRPQPDGWQIDAPKPAAVLNGTREENDILATHGTALRIRPSGFPITQTEVTNISDWSIDVAMGDGIDSLTATVVRGGPFGYYTVTRGAVEVEAAAPPDIFYRSKDGRVLGLAVNDKPFALFAPRGCRWTDGETPTRFALAAPPGQNYCGYFSVAALPDKRPRVVEEFRRYAFAFVTDTKIEWRYDEKRSEVITRFVASTEAKEGSERRTLLGLFPHHISGLSRRSVRKLGHEFPTIRGPMRLAAGREFRTVYRYHGILPWWPALQSPKASERLRGLLAEDMQFGPEQLLGNRGTYWEGKGLNRAAQVLAIADQAGARAESAALLNAIKARLALWFAPETDAPRYFHFNRSVGSLIGYPDEYGSATELNDHHFHYGYWIFGAAQVALREPEWASQANWGGMVDLLARDIASPEATAMFPKLRHFDAYEGHSWASGIVPFFDGNNQESSSEAINAWAALILWGEATGNRRLRDTGIYLYTTEIESAKQYWFDFSRQVFSPEYANTHASMVWGGKYSHGTWFTDEPRATLGINILPVTCASTYLGAAPTHTSRTMKALDGEFDHFLARGGRASPDVWQDVLLSYLALSDPKRALAQWNPDGSVEDGETRTHTYFWLQSLAELGRPRFDVTANTPLFGVFGTADGLTTYLAYNAGTQQRIVTFSNGVRLVVAPRSLGRIALSRKPQ